MGEPMFGLTRRRFLQYGAVGGVAVLVPRRLDARALSAVRPSALDPATIPKYELPLVIPPVMPPTPTSGLPGERRATSTTTRSRCASSSSRSCRRACPRPRSGATARSPIPAPSTIPRSPSRRRSTGRCGSSGSTAWSTPPATSCRTCCPSIRRCTGRTRRAGSTAGTAAPAFSSTPGPYTGPVPIVTHLHGGHSTEESDGYAEAWYLPAASNIPPGFATVGSFYDEFGPSSRHKFGVSAGSRARRCSSTRTTSAASTLWFHDHTLGMTRLNVYAGPAGFYLLRGGLGDLPEGVLPGPAPRLGDPPGTRYYEIPIVVQDRSFNADGSLFYPASRAVLRRLRRALHPGQRHLADLQPGVLRQHDGGQRPHLAGPPGRAAPVPLPLPERLQLPLRDPQDRHRPAGRRTGRAALPFWQIGAEGGFLPAPRAARPAADGPRRAGRRDRRLHRPAGRDRALPDQRGARTSRSAAACRGRTSPPPTRDTPARS